MEIEIKLVLEEPEAARLRDRLGPPVRTALQLNLYFDDGRRHLARAGWGLRLRTEDGGQSGVLTLKHSGRSESDFTHRPEYERQLSRDRFARLRGDMGELMQEARALLDDPSRLPDVELTAIGALENRRETFDHDGMVLELDRTDWPDRSRSHELEAEVDSPDGMARTRTGLKRLFGELGIEWRVGEQSKLQRLMAMLDGRPG